MRLGETGPVSQMHLRHLYPMAANVAEILRGFETVLIPEINNGQLYKLLRMELLADNLVSYPVVRGLPFRTSDILEKARELLG